MNDTLILLSAMRRRGRGTIRALRDSLDRQGFEAT